MVHPVDDYDDCQAIHHRCLRQMRGEELVDLRRPPGDEQSVLRVAPHRRRQSIPNRCRLVQSNLKEHVRMGGGETINPLYQKYQDYEYSTKRRFTVRRTDEDLIIPVTTPPRP